MTHLIGKHELFPLELIIKCFPSDSVMVTYFHGIQWNKLIDLC